MDQEQNIFRKKCMCMAKKHNLINNCLSCGKIICEQEGEGPCFFCGNPVYSKNFNENQMEQNFENFNEDYDNYKSYTTAVDYKEKLLNFEQNQIANKKIIDEDVDWYEIKQDVWQDKEVREEALKRLMEDENEEEENKRVANYEIDMRTGDVKEIIKSINIKEKQKQAQELIQQHTQRKKSIYTEKQLENEFEQGVVNQMKAFLDQAYDHQKQALRKIEEFKPIQHDDIYDNFNLFDELNTKKIQEEEQGYDMQLYDLENSFDSYCLSIYQPWASLVINGIKRFEGRQWSTNYRGPLWIHAGTNNPQKTDIDSTKGFYQQIYGKDFPGYPNKFDKGSLIGVVDLQDVWTQEQYKEKIPFPFNEESDQPYIFIFRNPRKLKVPIKMRGSPQIYDLPKEITQIALQQLEKVQTNWSPFQAQNFMALAQEKMLNPEKRKLNQEDQKVIPYEIYKQKNNSLLVFNSTNASLIYYLINQDSKFGKQLGISYESIKNFQLEDKQLHDTLTYLAKKHSSKNYLEKNLTVDLFRLNLQTKPFILAKNYLFFVSIGNMVKIVGSNNQKQSYSMKDTFLVFNEDCKESIKIQSIDRKKSGKFLKPLGEYSVLCAGFYQIIYINNGQRNANQSKFPHLRQRKNEQTYMIISIPSIDFLFDTNGLDYSLDKYIFLGPLFFRKKTMVNFH